MKFDVLKKRLAALTPTDKDCPFCRAVAALEDADWDQAIERLIKGEAVSMGLPEPSPTCSQCREAAAIDEAEIDKRLNRLLEIIGQPKEAAGA